MATTKVFVYGTLLRGEENHAELDGAGFVRAARTAPRYTLWDLGPYPGLVEGGSTAVEGEVWVVDDAHLARLDDFEGHPVLFRRASVEVEGESDVIAYHWVGTPEGRRLLNGRYRGRG